MRASLLTGTALLAAAIGFVGGQPLGSPGRDARLGQYLPGAQPVDIEGPAAFASGKRAMLMFSAAGVAGPMRGVVLVDGDEIERVVLFRSREGVTHDALDDRHLAGYMSRRFRSGRTPVPVVVDVVTGATVSSRRLSDAVNGRLSAWRATTDKRLDTATTVVAQP